MTSDKKYLITIGLEIHAQLQTESKIFCEDSTRFGGEPNTQVSPISLGHPGTLPVLNKRAVEQAVIMGLACNSIINRTSFFDRKNYFYPDLPKGYQTTQNNAPICLGGHLDVALQNGTHREILLNRIHLEEDAGKLLHSAGNFSRVDLNRAGIPLIEIVTEPMIESAEEAAAFLIEIRKLVRHLNVCDGNMEEGSLRCDANVSIRPIGAESLGKKVEIKNMNSVRFVQKAIESEYERQVSLLESGKAVVSETRLFDSSLGKTVAMRQKEELNDYRYFPDPDLQPVLVDDRWLATLAENLPELPKALKNRLKHQYDISESTAEFLSASRETAAYFESVCAHTLSAKSVANWLQGPVQAYLNSGSAESKRFTLTPYQLARLVDFVDTGKVSFSSAAQEIFPVLLLNSEKDPEEIAVHLNLIQVSDSELLEPIVNEVLARMPDKVKEYRAGKKGLLGLFVGEVKKASAGKADPRLTTEILLRLLG